MKYIPRIIDPIIAQGLGSMGAVVLEGARATGKTMTGMHHAGSVSRVDIELSRQPSVVNVPELLLQGQVPRLLDEWQALPALWNLVRHEVDLRQKPGQFILTGSAIPQDDITRHSGAGRFRRIRMRSMSTYEWSRPNNPTSISELLNGDPIRIGPSEATFETTLSRMVHGGWPALFDRVDTASAWVRDYVTELTRLDVAMLGTGQRSRDPMKIERVMKSLARNIGSALRVSTIIQDTSGDGGNIARETVTTYLDALRRVFLLEEIPAWQPHLRSSTELRTTPKFYFVDPSIGPATLGWSIEHMTKDLAYVGQVFENLVMRDLLVYAQYNNASVSYYRDNSGLEVDAILEAADGSWIAVEVKLGLRMLDEAAANLLKFRDKVNTGRMGEPKALVIITSGGYAFTRPDGVHVVPIDMLGP
jgi:predicted AAA+ superfamily ATPase